ncbi:hypothetical protein [Actinoallomurus sp. NPDC052274]|uniref:hypothetical protein n=1 Tax=Actinoallomurus sp. NPDC052274 TaxID=3155420 RepID=UPI00343A7A01
MVSRAGRHRGARAHRASLKNTTPTTPFSRRSRMAKKRKGRGPTPPNARRHGASKPATSGGTSSGRPSAQEKILAELRARREEAIAIGGGDMAPAVSEEKAAAGVEESVTAAADQASRPSPPVRSDDSESAEAWREAGEYLTIYKRAAEVLERMRQDLAEKDAQLNDRLDTAKIEIADAQEERERLRRRSAELDAREQSLLEAEAELFSRQEREKETVLAEARDALAGMRQEAEKRQRELAEEHERTRAVLHADLDARRDQLAEQEAELARERGRLRTLQVRLTADQEDLQDARELLSERVERAVQAAVERTERQCEQLEQRCLMLREHAEQLEKQLRDHDRLDRAFGNRTPEEVLTELDLLRKGNAELRQQRAIPEDTLERLAALQAAEQIWREDRAVLVADNERLQRRLSGHEVAAVELERLKVTKQDLEASLNSYRAHLEELRRDIEGLTERKEGESPFPECQAMDRRHLEPRDDVRHQMPPLSQFVPWLRDYMAQQYGMFYAENDLIMFLGGLAASRLHLFQGISGIGKTQLPIVFGKAIKAETVVVPVSADWRTPQDLVGYFNAFERRFYESPFTQALYKAGCPEFADRPFFVVLDEMNLSHPEQYFSEVLYQLGQKRRPDGAPPSLELMTTEVRPAPLRLVDGRKLAIPPNVWFIGTANHDETTVSFADKTYDRAHVLELPARPERFQPSLVEPQPGPVSLQALEKAFSDARHAHAESAGEVKTFMDGELRDRLLRDFRISSGSRTMTYLDAFVPVVLAAGGTTGDAADHALATRVLRKLRGRFEIPMRLIEGLREDLPRLWEPFKTAPHRSLERLDEEIHLRGGV